MHPNDAVAAPRLDPWEPRHATNLGSARVSEMQLVVHHWEGTWYLIKMGASISLVEMRGGDDKEYESGFMETSLEENLCSLLKCEICGDCGGGIVYTEKLAEMFSNLTVNKNSQFLF